MSHEVEVTGKALIASVPGALDGEAARGLSSALRGRGFPGALVVIEMSGVTEVDVEGITQVVALKRWAEREGGRLVLAAPSYEVMDSLRSNGLDRIFEIAPTRDAAVGVMAAAAVSEPAVAEPTRRGVGEADGFVPSPRAPEEPARRREFQEDPQNEWVKPSGGSVRPERAAPPAPAAPPPKLARAKGSGKRRWGLIVTVLVVLCGGGVAAWFLLKKHPEVLPQEGDWTRAEGSESEFEIKFRHAAGLIVKKDNLPPDLFLDQESTREYPDGSMSQFIRGEAKAAGDFSITVAAKPPGDADESMPVTFSFKITAQDIVNTGEGKRREFLVGEPLASGVHELVRGCARVSAEGLEGTGLGVLVDHSRRVATLEGTPEKAGKFELKLKAESGSKTAAFTYAVTVTAPGAGDPIAAAAVHNPVLSAIRDKLQSQPKPVPPKTGTGPATTGTGTGTGTTAGTATAKPNQEPYELSPAPKTRFDPVDPAMLVMLNDRIARSRFSEFEKARMRAAVDQVEFAKRIATVRFAHGERWISPVEREALLGILRSMPELKSEENTKALDFVVIGYASRSGTLAQNVAISKMRASSVEAVLSSAEFRIQPKFTGDYGATDALGPTEEHNRVVEVYAVKVKEETRDTLKMLIEHMKRVSGSH